MVCNKSLVNILLKLSCLNGNKVNQKQYCKCNCERGKMEENQPEYISETKMIKNQIASVVSNWVHLLELGLHKMEGWDERYTKF